MQRINEIFIFLIGHKLVVIRFFKPYGWLMKLVVRPFLWYLYQMDDAIFRDLRRLLYKAFSKAIQVLKIKLSESSYNA